MAQLQVNDKIQVNGWVMLKGLDNGLTYTVIAMDDYSYTFKTGRRKPVRHYITSVDAKMTGTSDINYIVKIN